MERRVFSLGDNPLNDTSAFSVVQETLFWLKRATMVTGSSGILKLSFETWKSRGTSSPIVAFLEVEFWVIPVVTQLASPAVVQPEPVYPLTQTQEQVSPLDTLTPPFEHGAVFSQLSVFWFCRGTTTRKMGIKTAAAIMMRRIMQRVINAHIGIPQHRRRCWGFPFSWSRFDSCPRS